MLSKGIIFKVFAIDAKEIKINKNVIWLTINKNENYFCNFCQNYVLTHIFFLQIFRYKK